MDSNNSINSDAIEKLLVFQIRRKITNLCKQQLISLEDLQSSKDCRISEEAFQRYRKRTLDFGNDAIRELEDHLKIFDINLKK